MPNVIGKNIKEAKEKLNGFNVEISGNGEKVIYQSPKAKTKLEEGKTVKLFTS